MAKSEDPHDEQPPEDGSAEDPGFYRVQDYLLYGLSLPERTIRSASGVLGGV